MAVLNTGLAKTSATGYTIDYSCRFDGSSSKLERTPAGASNKKTWTWSGWVKRAKIGSDQHILNTYTGTGSVNTSFFFENDALNFYDYEGGGGPGYQFHLTTSRVFRDTSSWYHIMCVLDTAESVEGDRAMVYINGTRETSFSSEDYPSLNFDDGHINDAVEHVIGTHNGDLDLDGYLAEVHFIDGAALTPSSFGETGDYGEWKPKEYDTADGAYGTNGYYLDFADAADLGDDESGEGNDWAETGLDVADQMLDTPTNNFATLNPLTPPQTDAIDLSEGNLSHNLTRYSYTSTMPLNNGSWYIELYTPADVNVLAGLTTELDVRTGYSSNSIFQFDSGGNVDSYNSTEDSDTYTGAVVDDIYGLAVNGTTGTCDVYQNNVKKIEISAISTTDDIFFFCDRSTTNSGRNVVNFGQDSSFAGNLTAQGNADGNGKGDFYYTPPSGYVALCTANLDTPAVIPSEHFNTVLYDGDGTASNAITGVGFQPDFVWIKMRSANIYHRMYDVLRGVTKGFATSSTLAEETEDRFISFDADGFTVAETVAGSQTNDDGDDFVAWNWKAASTASGTTSGSGTGKAYSARYNTDAGFSMVTYEGNDTAGHTIPHHLSKAPELIVVKRREATDPWCLFHHNLDPSTPEQYADEMNALASFHDSDYWNDTAPTSSVFTVGSSNNVNGLDEGYMTYCWHSVEGYSKCGVYEGNASTDGTFVYTGFRPKYLWYKNIDASSNWIVVDTERGTYNEYNIGMKINLSALEDNDDVYRLDVLSNGFKLRDSGTLQNAANTYIYFAIAETPFKYSNAR